MHPARGALVASMLVALAGCRPSPPHVVVITIDTLRADHISGLGYGRPTTPALDRLMADGVTFVAASTPTPTTGPAHASLFTGTYPRTHGLLKNGMVLQSDHPTLAEALKAEGYQTGAIVSAFPVARRFGLARGFDHYDDTFHPDDASIETGEWEGIRLDEAFDRRAHATTDRALERLEQMGRREPWFLWVHYYDVHAPYDPPPRYAQLFRPAVRTGRLGRAIAAYDGETRFVDDNIARLMQRIDTRFGSRNVLAVLATDHGEGLMDHGWMAHGVHLYEELVRVALAFRWVGRIPAGGRPALPVSLVDVAPTVLALLGLPASLLVPDGQDLSPVLRGEPSALPPRPIFFERRPYDTRDVKRVPVPGAMRAVRDQQWKYIEAPERGFRQLFDLSVDPGETRDLREAEPAISNRLARVLRAWQATPGDTSAKPVSDVDAARLRALGYVE